jgi:hypothetical protein
MGLTTTVRVDEEVLVDIDDDEIVECVCNDPELIHRILDGYDMGADQWAEHFAGSDAVGQEQMLAALRRVCPHMTIGFSK